MTAWAFPKPTRREKPRQTKPIARRKPLQAKHWGVSRGPSKTAHARRPRGWGKMLFLRTLPCDVRAAFAELYGPAVASVPRPGPCRGHRQVMHLGHKADPGGRRLPHDADTARGCEGHHQDIDGRIGGLGTWYVAMGREGQRAFRRLLRERAHAAWMALTDEQRAAWDERAEAERAALRARRALERAAG